MKTIFVFVLAGISGNLYAADWNHNPKSPIGFLEWGHVKHEFATCGERIAGAFEEVGKKQAPIAIEGAQAVPLPVLRFSYKLTPFKVDNTGHAVEVPYQEGSFLQLDNSTSPADHFEVQQFHFHAPSEHTLNGKHYPMELHIVHGNALGDLAVVSVLLRMTGSGNQLVDEIMTNAPLSQGSHDVEGQTLNVGRLLPGNRGNYYTYSGSLTTPPCTEGVRWFVLAEPISASQFAIDRLHLIISQFEHYDGYPNNNRATRPLNGRTIFQRAQP